MSFILIISPHTHTHRNDAFLFSSSTRISASSSSTTVKMARGTSSSRNGGERERERTSHRSSAGASDSRISRSYRSPPPSSRPTEHRSRRDSSTPPAPSSCLSNFYRERFGSHSPEDYLNLRLSQFEPKMGKEHIRGVLEREFRHLAPFEIKIVRNPEDDERLAYVNFERPDCAKSVRRSLLPRLQKMLGRTIGVDPAGVIRDQEGKFIPDRYNRAVMAAAERSPTGGGGPVPLRRAASPVQPRRPPPRRMEMPVFHLNQDDTQAGRTIFVGNLPGDVRDTELRRLFEDFGTVDEVDIKLLADSNAAYAFVLFETVEQALAAREGQHNKPMRPGEYRCQLGYGKTQPCASLIIGGLGPWASEELLEKAFCDYGEISSIQFDGDTHGYIRFAEQTAATEACSAMKNFPLGGDDKCITVDYAKDEKKDDEKRVPTAPRKRPYDGQHHYHHNQQHESAEAKRARQRTPSPSQSPTRVGCFESYIQLRGTVPCTWKGVLMLKKSEYPLSLYRVFGREHLVQDFLRDSDGVALRLSINQRLPVVADLYTKLSEYDRTQLAVLFAMERDRPCEPLVKYLQEKNAAGVISVPGAVLYVLTHTPITEKLVKFFAPRICPLLTPMPNHLVLVLKLTAQPTVNNVMSTTLAPAPGGGGTVGAAATSYGLLNATMAPPSLVEVKKEMDATAKADSWKVLGEEAAAAPIADNKLYKDGES
uniref:RNA-binding protein n=1 Tax=Globodera rostochiensis TaxID=31243 RepID=A0A914HBW2_GLORO